MLKSDLNKKLDVVILSLLLMFVILISAFIALLKIEFLLFFFGSIVVGIWLVLIFLNPFLGVVTLFAMFPFKFEFYISNTFISTNELLVFYMLFVMVFRGLFLGKKLPQFTKYHILFLIFVFFIAFSVLHSVNKEETVKGILRYIGYLLLFIVVLRYADSIKRIKILLITLIAVHILLSLYGFYQVKTIKVFEWFGINIFRLKAVYDNPNNFAIVIEYLIPITIGLYWGGVIKKKFLAYLLLAIFFIAIIFTQTRTSWIAIAFVVIFMLYQRYKGKVLLIFPIMVLVLLLLIPIYPDFVKQRAETIFDPNYTANKGRIVLFKTAYNMFKDYWLFGTGFGNSDNVFDKYRLPGVPHNIRDIHNMYMVVIVEIGIIGGMFFLLFFILSYIDIMKVYKKVDDKELKYIALGIGSGLLCVGIHLLNDHVFNDVRVEWLFWGMLGVISSFNRIIRTKTL